jgi:hypothetical protein
MYGKPKTVEAAVHRLLSEMSAHEKEELKQISRERLGVYHFSLGLYIRNNFGLWHENNELIKSCAMAKRKSGDCMYDDGLLFLDPDDCSGVIIEALWERLQKI